LPFPSPERRGGQGVRTGTNPALLPRKGRSSCMQRHLGWMVLVGALTVTVYSACQSPVAAGGIMLTGQWGSEQGRFTATQVSTAFNGACGSGSTLEPIMLDK